MFFSQGAIEIQSIDTNKIFKVNGHRLKPFVEKEVKLVDPIYKDE